MNRTMDQQVNLSDASALAGIAAKLVPAGLGALIMVAIDPPANRKELFYRLAAAGLCSIFLGDIAIDALHAWWPVIDPMKHTHQSAVSFIVGGCGWFVLGGLGILLKKLRTDPVGVIEDVKKVAP